MTPDIASWTRHARTYLLQRGLDEDKSEIALDLQALISQATTHPRTWILAHPDCQLTGEQEKNLDNLLMRLGNGEPLPYILGHWEFFGLDFIVSPAVLIPRPETELLVEEALNWLLLHPQVDWAVDVGTGCGCISVSLASSIKDLHILAIDRSITALQVAKRNISKHCLAHQITLINSHLTSAICSENKIKLVCANLPYIPSYRLHELKVSRYEPLIALEGGFDGLDHVKSLIIDAKYWLAVDGLLLLEIDKDQNLISAAIARQVFPSACIKIIADLAGHPRILRIENHENDHHPM